MDSQEPVSVDTVEVSMQTISSFCRCFSSLEGGFTLLPPSYILLSTEPLEEGRTSTAAAPLQSGLEIGEKVSRSSPTSNSQVLAEPDPERDPEADPLCCWGCGGSCCGCSAAARISALYWGAEDEEDEEEQAEGLLALLPLLLLLVRFE